MYFDEVLQQFSQRLSLPAIELNAAGLAALDIADVGRLYIEISNQSGQAELLLYLSQNVLPSHAKDLARRALSYCHYKHVHPFQVWAGVYRDQLIVLTRFLENTATAAALENAAIFLMRSLETLNKA
ncbi:MAG: CesT family type III secretion system chaperone [Desulfovibrionaceae bacterium]|nr:CesT family type III secretion system chaperone [Desulfovibrionaceae bacterium]